MAFIGNISDRIELKRTILRLWITLHIDDEIDHFNIEANLS